MKNRIGTRVLERPEQRNRKTIIRKQAGRVQILFAEQCERTRRVYVNCNFQL